MMVNKGDDASLLNTTSSVYGVVILVSYQGIWTLLNWVGQVLDQVGAAMPLP